MGHGPSTVSKIPEGAGGRKASSAGRGRAKDYESPYVPLEFVEEAVPAHARTSSIVQRVRCSCGLAADLHLLA